MTALTLKEAKALIASAEKRADEIGQPMNIAVVDAEATSSPTSARTAHGSAALISRSTRPGHHALSTSRPKTSARTRNQIDSSTVSTQQTAAG